MPMKSKVKREPALLKPSDRKQIQGLMKEGDFDGAKKAASAAIVTRSALKKYGTVDAITSTSKRRKPMSIVSSLDSEFRSISDRNKMVSTARNLEVNFSLFRGITQGHLNYVIGSGPRIQIQTTDNDFNDRGEKKFGGWSKNPDVRGVMDFGGMIKVNERRTVVDGDCFLHLLRTGQLQGIEGDRIANPPDVGSSDRAWVLGVNVNPVLRPLGYGVYSRGNQNFRSSPSTKDFLKVIKSKDMIHSFDPERFDQSRGISSMISAINDHQDLREALEAVKGSIKLENILGLIFTSDMPTVSGADPMGALTTYEESAADGSNETRNEFKVSQGVFSTSLLPGEDVKAIQKQTPGTNFDPWVMFQARLAAVVLDMPIEVALQFYTRGSFSALKGALSQYRYAVGIKRSRIERQTLDRIGFWRLSAWMRLWDQEVKAQVPKDKRRGLEPPKEGTVFDRDAISWQWPEAPLLEPGKQIDADVKEYKARSSTLKRINAKRGQDWEEVARQQGREMKKLEQIEMELELPAGALSPEVSKPGEVKSEPVEPDDKDDGGRDDDD